jgi:hypothetical protein
VQNLLVVRVTTPSGTPVVGAPVTYSAGAGGGSMNPAVVLTDAQGLAASVYTLPWSYTQPLVVTATGAGTSYVAFDVVWRGLSVAYMPPPFNTISAELRHSQTASPFTLAWEPPAQTPYLVTPWGEVWTTVLNPLAGIQTLDGLGLLGPPQPQVKTDPSSPYWSLTVTNLPPFGGMTLLFQAYAIDTALFPAPESIMISNPQVVTIP